MHLLTDKENKNDGYCEKKKNDTAAFTETTPMAVENFERVHKYTEVSFQQAVVNILRIVQAISSPVDVHQFPRPLHHQLPGIDQESILLLLLLLTSRFILPPRVSRITDVSVWHRTL
ncbi:uncharacterized protein MYCFIDRAFT_169046 [Pseudocercospora fijiensis CIRAD86]|uniref:Uncharacterized protein n=1 Tax=Pseudocercospora fijiensis (strain CIRAD86) TaxID=383855 RepID=N1Q6W4_PSEFD|nr:uncharacterized protein MYCFIDRAFT_169046 [Pseudocercospora fijiensis CIRAD86]EME87186.1 hypothetical protein MYCFIDRAFT_169046 [Pseudocercospora fijiensis CIRAD86]